MHDPPDSVRGTCQMGIKEVWLMNVARCWPAVFRWFESQILPLWLSLWLIIPGCSLSHLLQLSFCSEVIVLLIYVYYSSWCFLEYLFFNLLPNQKVPITFDLFLTPSAVFVFNHLSFFFPGHVCQFSSRNVEFPIVICVTFVLICPILLYSNL